MSEKSLSSLSYRTNAQCGRRRVAIVGDELGAAAEYHVDFDEGILVREGVEFEDDGRRSVPVNQHLRDVDEEAMISEARFVVLHLESEWWRQV